MKSANRMMNENEIKEKYLKGNKMKLKISKVATVLMIITSVLLSVFVFGSPDNTIPDNWVYDKDKILNDATIRDINNKNGVLYSATGSEIVVVVEKDSGNNRDLIKRAEKLFKSYKVSDSGVLFIISVPAKDTASSGGIVGEIIDSVQSTIDDIFGNTRNSYAYCIGRNVDYSLAGMADNIFANNFQINYNEGNYNAAVLNTFNAFADYFEQYYKLSINDYGYGATVYGSNNFTAYKTINLTAGLFGIFVFAVLLGIIFGRKRGTGIHRIYRNPFWFGTGLGLGWGMGGRSRYRHNSGMHWGNTRNSGSFFRNSHSPGGRSGGGFTRNTNNRSGGGFGHSGRSGGGGFRNGGGSGRSGGGGRR